MKLSLQSTALVLSIIITGKAFVVPQLFASRESRTTIVSPSIRPKPKQHALALGLLGATRAKQKDRPVDKEDEREDFEFYQPSEKSFQDFQDELQALAFLSSSDRNAATRAQAVFDEMYEAYILQQRSDLWPNVTIYNLLIDSHAWSPSRQGASRAQVILDRMENETGVDDDGSDFTIIARPNVDTYIKVIEAWANRKQPERATQVFDALVKRYESLRSDDLRPNTGVYNKLIKAWMKRGKPEAPHMAETLLKEMIELHGSQDNEAVKPNQKTYVQVMKTYSEQPSVESVEKITEILQSMARRYRLLGDEQCQPDTRCYNVLIKTTGQVPALQEQTEELLYSMMESYQQGRNEALRPNGATFVNVYNSFRSTTDPDKAADTVEKILTLQEDTSQGMDDDMEPDVRAYNAVLAVLSRATDPDKARRAKDILDRMIEKRDKGNDKRVAPTCRTYNTILNACAYTQGTPRERMEAFRIAVDCINDLRQSSLLEPDPVSYGLFLRSCAQLMPPNPKRESVVENIFRKCCADGQVGTFVLHELGRAASPQLCKKLLGGDMNDGVNLPMEWSRNVQNKRQRLH